MVAAHRHAYGMTRVARLFFLLAVLVLGTAIGLDWLLMREFGRTFHGDHLVFPVAFVFSTFFLAVGSLTLEMAVRAVRREKQQRFRFWLGLSLASAALFTGSQLYGLWAMFPQQRVAAAAALGVTGFIVAFTALHTTHFIVATLFVCFITARSINDRYDHEYYWGVTVCAWFWHALGIAWIAILCIFAIAL